MSWSKKTWFALGFGTIVTLLTMQVGLSLLEHVRVTRGESEESVWITSNRDLGELPLAQSECFSMHTDWVGGSPQQIEEFQRVLQDPNAEEAFAALAGGPGGARLYGLCGLKALRSTRLSYYMSLAAADDREVATTNGCTIYIQRVRDVLQNPGFLARCEELSVGELPNKALQTLVGSSRRK